MHINEFIKRISDVYDNICVLNEEVNDRYKLNYLSDIFKYIEFFYTFTLNNRNIILLEKFYTDEDVDILCPLDALCYSIKCKFDTIYHVLDAEIFLINNFLSNDYRYTEKRTTFANIIKDQKFINLLKAFEVLRCLDGYNKTLIILGPNGGGKTSFANYLKGVEEYIKVIPASKPIRSTGHAYQVWDSTIENFNNEFYTRAVAEEVLLRKLIVGLCSEHDDAARRLRDTGERGEETTYEKVKNIFDDFFEVKLDNSAFGKKEMQAIKNGGEAFNFNDMSDGERVAFFYMATVIAAPMSSFIVVDEPENHLNPAIYNKIWDRLIDVRKDCQFIFISHTIDFIRARSNFELVKIKSFVRPDKFEFEFLGSSLEDIKSEHIVEIVGSRKPILFCEGVKDKYDYKIYESLFGAKYTVIPTESCESVKSSVVACNTHASTYSIQSAIGIIDSDLKSESEIESLMGKNIYALRCNEIEMLLLDEYIFKAVLQHQFMNESEFEKFKSVFMSKVNARKDYIVKRLVKIQIDEKLSTLKIDDKKHKTKEELKSNLSDIFSCIDVDTLWKEAEERVAIAITEGDYEVALRLCCLEHQEIIGGIVNKIIPNYDTIALGLLSSSQELADRIRNKYFSEVPMNV